MAEKKKSATFSSIEEELQKKISSMENQMRLLELEYRNQEREIQTFLENEGIELVKMQEYIENGGALPKEWVDALEEERQKFKEKLDLRLSQIRNPELLQKKYEERRVDPRWLYVK